MKTLQKQIKEGKKKGTLISSEVEELEEPMNTSQVNDMPSEYDDEVHHHNNNYYYYYFKFHYDNLRA